MVKPCNHFFQSFSFGLEDGREIDWRGKQGKKEEMIKRKREELSGIPAAGRGSRSDLKVICVLPGRSASTLVLFLIMLRPPGNRDSLRDLKCDPSSSLKRSGSPLLPALQRQEPRKRCHYLGRGAVELQQPVLQPLRPGLELLAVPAQQALVEPDELQKRLGGCVVVALLVAQVRLGCLVDTRVDKSHELANRLLDCGLKSKSRK